MSPSNPSLDILSVASFPDTLPQRTPPSFYQGSTSELYGGLLIHADGQSTPENNVPRRKEASVTFDNNRNRQRRTKRTKNAQEQSQPSNGEAARKRGRPRVDAADESASERRRTQIRLAQRAYRLRKESALSSLHQRVAELEKTAEKMSNTFLALNDQVMKSGLLVSQPELTRQFRGATERFLSLAKVASPDPTDGEDDGGASEESHPGSGSVLQPVNSMASQPRIDLNQSRGTDSSSKLDCFDPTTVTSSAAAQQQMNSSLTAWISPSPEIHNMLSLEYLFTAGMPDFKVPRSLDIPWAHHPLAPYTYSFQETTFSRRLHRRCIEMGYSALKNPNVSPLRLQKTFRFSFNLASREQMVNAFHLLLQREAGEPLEFWNRPYYNIGGAGTHYPRADKYGNEIYPPNIHPLDKAFGPLALHQSETRHSYKTIEEIIEATGFGGKWFDCHDVEGYMNSKGIFLGSSSPYIEIHPSIIASLDSGSSTQLHMPMDPQTDRTSNAPLSPSFYSTDSQTGIQTLGRLGIHGGNLVIPGLSNAQGGIPNMALPTNLAVLDVDRFLNKLTFGAVCLGRAPGFRQEDVDQALRSCISINSGHDSGDAWN